MAETKIDLLTPLQRRRLKILRLVALVAALVVGAGVFAAFLIHWTLGLVALFLAPMAVYLLVALFETIVPGD